MHGLFVAGGPGHHAIRTDILGLASRPPILHHLAVLAAIGDEDIGDGLDVILVRRGDPVDRIRIVGLQVGIVLQSVRSHEVQRDIPIAIADDADHGLALHALRIRLPLGRAEQRILAIRAAHGADDHRLVLRPQLLQNRIQIGEPLAAAVAHHDDRLGSLRAGLFPVVELLGAVGKVVPHLRIRVLAMQRQVHAVLLHQRALGGIRAAIGVDQRVHCIPLPDIECDMSRGNVGWSGGRIGQRLHVGHLRLLLRRKGNAGCDDRLHDPGGWNQAMLHGGTQPEDRARCDDYDQE